jgi:MGT family glycosyltransferase
MSRILAYTTPAKGHLFPVAGILEELQRRGHDVSVWTLASGVDMMRGQGIPARPISPDVEAVVMQDWTQRSPQKALAASVATFVRRAESDGPDLARAIAEENPDVLLIDINAWGAMAVAETSGRPWAAFCPYPLPVVSKDVPPYGPGLAPARGPLGRLRDQLLAPVVIGTLEKKMLPGLNAVRAEVGLPALAHLQDLFRLPPLVLYLTAEPFEYPRSDWPDNVAMVGPVEWEPPFSPGSGPEFTGQPLVVVTTSSEFQDDGRLVQAALDGLADEPVQVIATVPAGDPRDFRVPGNGRVERFVPHSMLFDRAAVVVTHGGMGATQKALAAGVPVCAVPFGRDQSEVARRVEVAGAGTRLPARRLSPRRLRRSVGLAMARGEGARRVADGYRRAGGAPAAADAVGVLLGSVTA